MRAAKAAAERTEDKEIDLLLSEIPHVTSPQGRQRGVGVIGDGNGNGNGNGVHGASGSDGYTSPMRIGCRRVHCPSGADGYDAQRHGKDAYYDMVLNRRDNGAPLHGGDAGAVGFPALGVDDQEHQLVANQLRGLRIGDAQAALQRQGPPPVMSAATTEVPAAHGAYHGYNFAASGSSVRQEHMFLDQAKPVGYVAARPHRFVSDVGLDDYGGYPRALDTSIGGFMYNRVGHGTGIGWCQGLVQPDFAESYLLSSQAGAEFSSSSPVALKRHYAYGGVPVAANGFARGINQFDAFHCDNSLMFDGKNMNFLERERERRFQRVNSRALELGSSRTLRFDNVVRVKEGSIYHMAKDQNGCRYLQDKFLEGKHHVDAIFEGIINHIADLMISSFGNYLVQKMLEVCDEGQRLRIILVLTQDPVKQLIAISLNTHGTRVVQRLIETVRSRDQIMLIISALQPSFMLLVNDPNGNHVIQKCLTNFGAEDNKFIFEGAAANCFNMAVHRHGCCVLQRCISNARGVYQANLIVEICARGFELAQDPFGNYVVQYVLELKIPSANAHLASQFEGKYIYLSKQKVSSNVVERCLKFFPDDAKAVIVHELLLLSGSHFEQLLQDPYANYVIYTALLHTKGHLHSALVEAIRPHEDAIRTSPCCKRICRALSRR
ncbi:unnamed protein product [Miscanthus lutarioriparius]|uniref:PUM-HD domain-containing protein n=1 Tax=Miscanthus lutarioriparius TaxID=422564 RepID=A0A811M848_9POAL|nr:unnamed protein product [Miscanthus lutarioriparius]